MKKKHIPETKKCNDCKAIKNKSEFGIIRYKSKLKKNVILTRPTPYCKKCNNIRRKSWAKKNPEKILIYSKTHNLTCHLRKKFGINIEQYNKMLESQNFRCKICLSKYSDFKYRLGVDHCHKTGAVRALLCVNCNRGLGGFKDNIAFLNKAIKYLEEYETNNN